MMWFKMDNLANTKDLEPAIRERYIENMRKICILTKQDNDLVITGPYLKAINSFNKKVLNQQIKDEIQNDDLERIIAMCDCFLLFDWNIERKDLFHSVNILSWMMNKAQIENCHYEKVFGWIDYLHSKPISSKLH